MKRSLALPGTRGIALACASVLLAGVATAQWQTSPLNVANVSPFWYDFHDTANWTGGTINGQLPIGPSATGTAWLLADPAQSLPALAATWGANATRLLAIGGKDGVLRSVASVPGDVDMATETITLASHGFQTGDRLIVLSDFTNNGGIGRTGTERYAVRVGDNQFKLSLTADGSNLVNITGTLSGVLAFAKIPYVTAPATISYTKTVNGGDNTFQLGTLGSTAGASANTPEYAYGLNLTQNLTVHVHNNYSAGQAFLRVNQGITGNYGIVKTGNGQLALGAASNGAQSLGNFTGGVTLNEGSLHVVHGATLVGTTLVGSPLGLGTLTFADGTRLAQGNANYTIANPIDVGSGNVIFAHDGSSNTTTLSGPIAGSGTLTLTNSTAGTGRMIRFGGATANALGGTVQATGQIEFELNKSANTAAMASGTLRVRDNAILRFVGTAHHNLTQNVTVSLENAGRVTFGSNANRQSVGKLLLNTSNATPIEMTHADSAWLSVGEPTTLANASGPAVHLRNGGVLGGAASLNLPLRVSAAGGKIAPGASGDGTVGTLTLAGGMNQTAPATFAFDLGGTAGAADQLKLAGGAVSFTSGNVIDLANLGASAIVPGVWTTLVDTTGATSLGGFTLGNFTAGEVAEALGSPSFQIVGSGNAQQLQVSFLSGGTVILVR
jgi:hypothetical protein